MSDKKIYRPYDFLNTIKVEELDTLPAWTASDRRRLIRVIADSKFYFGGNAAWEEVPKGTHNHDSRYAAEVHTHTTIPNTLNITGGLTVDETVVVAGFSVGAAEVIDITGFIDFSRIKNHPTYCSTDCDCDCTSNCDCDCQCCEA